MPRTLPWLVQAKKQTNPTTSSSSPAQPSRRKRSATPPSDQDLVDSDLNPVGVSTPARRAATKSLRPARSPSTSPPPALPAPPPVEYMHEGFTADDAWMMVEDEFLTTAQSYTQHLHHAAYAEAKRRAKARGERTLRNLGRATDGVTEQREGLKLELEAEAMRRKREDAADDEGEDGMEWEVDPQLAGLMNRVDRKRMELKGLGKVRSSTRAAKGFLRSPEKERRTRRLPNERMLEDESEEDESDDLDAPARRRESAQPRPRKKELLRSKTAGLTKEQQLKADKRKSTGLFDRFAAARRETAASTSVTKRKDVAASPEKRENSVPKRSRIDLDRIAPSDKSTRGLVDPKKSDKDRETEEFLRRRAARREKRLQEEKKVAEEKTKKVYDDLPTFMI